MTVTPATMSGKKEKETPEMEKTKATRKPRLSAADVSRMVVELDTITGIDHVMRELVDRTDKRRKFYTLTPEGGAPSRMLPLPDFARYVQGLIDEANFRKGKNTTIATTGHDGNLAIIAQIEHHDITS